MDRSDGYGLLSRPSVPDLRSEAVIVGLLENRPKFTLTHEGAKLFDDDFLRELSADGLTAEQVLAATVPEVESMIVTDDWMERFLEYALRDPRMTAFLEGHTTQILERTGEHGIRTRTYEMLLGVRILEMLEKQSRIVMTRDGVGFMRST